MSTTGQLAMTTSCTSPRATSELMVGGRLPRTRLSKMFSIEGELVAITSQIKISAF